MLKQSNHPLSCRWSACALLVMGVMYGATAQAKATRSGLLPSQVVQYVLTDPVLNLPLVNTPYVLMTPHGANNGGMQPMLTDDKGHTRVLKETQRYDLNDPAAPVILVQAEGRGSQMLLLNLNDAVGEPVAAETAVAAESTPVASKGTAYLIWNKDSNQALCGHANVQGFTQAYFMKAGTAWDEGNYLVRLKDGAVCADARTAMAQLNDEMDSEAFEQGLNYARGHFSLTGKQMDGFVYEHVSNMIHNQAVDIDRGANKRVLNQAIDMARGTGDAAQLNMLGYSLGFERQAYKRSLPLLTEALKIKPNDCYYSNSKGYVLMRQGDLNASRELLQASDVACQADRARGGSALRDQDPIYPIAVNLAHLAENYGLSGDAYMANDFLNRALKEGSVRAKDEISEVVKHLGDKKIISDDNLRIFALYLNYVEKSNDKTNGKTAPQKEMPTVPKNKSKAKAKIIAK